MFTVQTLIRDVVKFAKNFVSLLWNEVEESITAFTDSKDYIYESVSTTFDWGEVANSLSSCSKPPLETSLKPDLSFDWNSAYSYLSQPQSYIAA